MVDNLFPFFEEFVVDMTFELCPLESEGCGGLILTAYPPPVSQSTLNPTHTGGGGHERTIQ